MLNRVKHLCVQSTRPFTTFRVTLSFKAAGQVSDLSRQFRPLCPLHLCGESSLRDDVDQLARHDDHLTHRLALDEALHALVA